MFQAIGKKKKYQRDFFVLKRMHGNLAIKNTCKCNEHSLPPHQVEQFGGDGGHLNTTIKYWELNHEEIV